ncbi:MAG: pyruvate dehydrogenase, partial [Gammaproteobacteria bacterium]|nr:pyruvate dehydrogenase [Gammaproteobacteria bacterium]
MNAVEPWPRSAGPREDRSAADPGVPAPGLDWERVVRGALLSRALDDLEETRLLPARRLFYQFSARGHEVTQAMLAQYLTGPRDAVGAYYRSRPLLLALGLPCADALAGSLMRANGASGGRDIGVVFNWPRAEGACVLPACGGVGAQYTPAAGWAQAIRYRALVLGDRRYEHCIAVAHGGEASTATNGFWAALNLATTQRLPLLLFIEDNGYGISVTSDWQTPGGNIAENLRAFSGLYALEADAAEPMRAAEAIAAAVNHVRVGEGPALLRLRVPRLCGHSGQDTQTYKSAEQIDAERARDPLAALKRMLQERGLSAARWEALEREAASSVEAALAEAERQPPADPDS